MSNKKCGIVILSVGLLAASSIIVLESNKNAFAFSKAGENEYVLEFTSSKNLLTPNNLLVSGSNTVTTDEGGSVVFDYENIKHEDGSAVTIENGSLHNVTAINDISKIDVNVLSGSLDIFYGTLTSGSIVYSTTLTGLTGEQSIDIIGTATHVKLVADESAKIGSLKFTYACANTIQTSIETPTLVGNGSAAHPYEIASSAEWNTFVAMSSSSELTDVHFALTSDIGSAAAPITNPAAKTQFSGFFDGKDHEVYLAIDLSSDSGGRGGLFRYLNKGTIQNLTVRGSVTAQKVLGGVVGEIKGPATLKNLTNYVSVTSTSADSVGGIAGIVNGSKSLTVPMFESCVNYGTIKSVNGGVGGIVGQSNTKNVTFWMKGCENHGQILSSKGANVGGIIGNLNQTGIVFKLTDSLNTVDITSSGQGLGGIIGRSGAGAELQFNNVSNSGNLSCSYSTTGTDGGVGGLIGKNNGSLTGYELTNTGNVTLTGTTNKLYGVGGIVGMGDGNATITLASNSGKITAAAGLGGNGGAGIYGYANGNVTITNSVNSGDIEINGSLQGVGGFIGMTTGKTGGIAYHVEDCFNSGNIVGYRIIGGFLGQVDNGLVGAGISTLARCINIGNISSRDGVVANIKVGGFVGGYADKMTECLHTITSCTNYGDVTAPTAGQWAYAGGIVAYLNNYVEMDKCVNYGEVSGDSAAVGGITSEARPYSSVSNCFNFGYVEGKGSRIGGIAGSVCDHTLTTNCVNFGYVEYIDGPGLESGAGGITGLAMVGAEVTFCTNFGIVSSSVGKTGGIVGAVNAQEAGVPGAYITSCFNFGLVDSDIDDCAGIVGSNFGKETEELVVTFPDGFAVSLVDCYDYTATGSTNVDEDLAKLISTYNGNIPENTTSVNRVTIDLDDFWIEADGALFLIGKDKDGELSASAVLSDGSKLYADINTLVVDEVKLVKLTSGQTEPDLEEESNYAKATNYVATATGDVLLLDSATTLSSAVTSTINEFAFDLSSLENLPEEGLIAKFLVTDMVTDEVRVEDGVVEDGKLVIQGDLFETIKVVFYEAGTTVFDVDGYALTTAELLPNQNGDVCAFVALDIYPMLPLVIGYLA